MSQYAADTSVGVDKSKAEIERTLMRYGADLFAYAWDNDRAVIGFRVHERQVRIVLPLPDRNDRRFTHHSRGARTPEQALREWEQACRQRWRALALVVKAKLEAVESGISTVEREFLTDIIMSNGQTVGEWVHPQIEKMYLDGKMPTLLMGS